MPAALKILLVDDEEADRLLTRRLLEESLDGRFELETADSFAAGLEAVCSGRYEVCLLDYDLGARAGVELIQEALAAGCRTPMIVLTDLGDARGDLQAIRAGAADFLVKERLDAPTLERSLRHAMERFQAEEALRASEERFRALVENSTDAITLLSADGHVLYSSPAAYRILGYAPGERAGEHPFSAVHPDDLELVTATYLRLLESAGESLSAEFRCRHKDGSWRWLDAVGTNFLHRPNVGALVVNYRDATQRRQAEEALRRSEERYRSLMENSSDIITVLDENGIVRYHSPSLVHLLGHDPRGLRGTPVLEFIHPEDRARTQQEFDALVRTPGGTKAFECRVLDAGGEWRVLDCMGQNLAEDPGVRGLVISSRDVTARRATEAREHAMSRGLRSVLDAADELLRAPDLDHLLRRAVELARERMGLERAAIFLHSACKQHFQGTYGTDFAGQTVEERACRLPTHGFWARYLHPVAPNEPRWMLRENTSLVEWRGDHGASVANGWVAITPILSSHGPVGFFCNDTARTGAPCDPVVQEIIAVYCSLLGNLLERKQAEEALQRSESSLAEAQRIARLGTWDYDPAQRLMHCSDTVFRIFGLPRAEDGSPTLPAQAFFELVHPEDRDFVMAAAVEALSGGSDYRVEHRILLPDGSERILAAQGEVTFDAEKRPIRLVGTLQDITDHKGLEEQLRQAQKMEAVGRLAGGVAHDFNNMLAVITGYTEILLERGDSANPLYTCLEEIKKASERASSLTRQLLAFSRKQVVTPKLLDLNSVILNVQEMLQRLIGEDVQLECRLSPGLGAVKADPGQLEQVLLNLVVNARDAMPQGGQLVVETCGLRLGAEEAGPFSGTAPGDYVQLTLTDTGTGMDEETLSHIFEPFFTTKPVGRGTGLGLATVYAVVEQCGGRVTASSEPGQGSTFRILLPALEILHPNPEPGDRVAAPRGTETVLMVEDEDMVRRLVRDILQRNGYCVLETSDAVEALHVCTHHPEPIHLLVTDVVMPGMSGRELAERVATLRPDMKVLFMSGYTDDAVVRHGVLDVGTSFIQKPFTPLALARQIRQVLEGN